MSMSIFVPADRQKLTSHDVTVSLDEADMRLARRLAHERGAVKREHGVAARKVDQRRDQMTIDLVGMMGEIAVARFLDVPVNERINLSGDGGVFDLVYAGKTVEVKATPLPHGRLIFGGPTSFLADVAVLAIVARPPAIRIPGWISRDDFAAKHFIKDLGYGERQCVTQVMLSDMRSLLADGDQLKPERRARGWPSIPPEYEGWSFHGSRFPSYYDEEFDRFREYHGEQLGASGEGQCRVHHRFLSYPETQAGGCFECEPWLDTRSKRHTATGRSSRVASQPANSDADDAQESFW